MLVITVPGVESFDDDNEIFVQTNDEVLNLEHSLVSLSKWEARYEKPFLTGDEKADDEIRGYINAMSMTGDISPEVLYRLTNDNFRAINEYIEAKMTATWFRETTQPKGYNSEVVTSEIIYHWIVALGLDWQVQNWHLNKLITLIKTINEKNKAASDTKKKAPTSAQMEDRRQLMEQRRRAAEAASGRT